MELSFPLHCVPFPCVSCLSLLASRFLTLSEIFRFSVFLRGLPLRELPETLRGLPLGELPKPHRELPLRELPESRKELPLGELPRPDTRRPGQIVFPRTSVWPLLTGP